MKAITTLSENYIIEKRNVLNEMLARKWTLQELRFFTIYLSRIDARKPNETRLVRFSLTEFKRIMDLKRTQEKDIKPITDRLLQKIVHLPINGGYTAFQLFKECSLINYNGFCHVEINAHDKALPLMFDFKDRYFTYELWNTIRLNSVNQHRMYEILKQFEALGERTLTLEQIRILLGIEPAEYIGRDGWQNFKVRVLNSCQKALAENTDIKFTYEPIRQGRKIAAVRFIIEKNKNYNGQISFDDYIVIDEYNRNQIAEKTINNQKDELSEAKQNPMWYFALERANQIMEKSNNIKVTAERYAIGILNNWKKSGYENESDLKDNGVIPQNMTEPSFNLDEHEELILNSYAKN